MLDDLQEKMMGGNDTLTFGEIFWAIRQGDIGVLAGFSLECLIMASPFLIIGGAIWFS